MSAEATFRTPAHTAKMLPLLAGYINTDLSNIKASKPKLKEIVGHKVVNMRFDFERVNKGMNEPLK